MAFSFNFAFPAAIDNAGAARDSEPLTQLDGATATLVVASDSRRTPISTPVAHIVIATLHTAAALPSVDVGHGLKRVVVDVDGVSGSHLDVVGGSYEGGAKVWECTEDMLSYLQTHDSLLAGRAVLDLGCGAGLLGAFALRQGAASASFQDLNASVLESITAPTVAINVPAHDSGCVHFVAGGWRSLAAELAAAPAAFPAVMNHGCDVVLASEVLYNVDYYRDLCAVLEAVLAPGGVALIATKRFYYGVGGGVVAFQAFAAQPHWRFAVCILATIEDGHSMIRDILQLKRRGDAAPCIAPVDPT